VSADAVPPSISEPLEWLDADIATLSRPAGTTGPPILLTYARRFKETRGFGKLASKFFHVRAVRAPDMADYDDVGRLLQARAALWTRMNSFETSLEGESPADAATTFLLECAKLEKDADGIEIALKRELAGVQEHDGSWLSSDCALTPRFAESRNALVWALRTLEDAQSAADSSSSAANSLHEAANLFGDSDSSESESNDGSGDGSDCPTSGPDKHSALFQSAGFLEPTNRQMIVYIMWRRAGVPGPPLSE